MPAPLISLLLATMMRDFRIAGNRALTHLAFWSVFFLVNGFVRGYCAEQATTAYFRDAFWGETKELPFLLGLVYLNLYVLIPRFFITKRYFLYLLTVLSSFVIASMLIRTTQSSDNTHLPAYLYSLGRIMMLNICPIFFVATFIKLWQLWYRQLQMNREILEEKLKAELNYLKAQVHPHFLFNTLNNLYSLTLARSEAAPGVVLKLSALMRYMVHDCRSEKIPLEQEIQSMASYIELEKIRFDQRLEISFNVHNAIKGPVITPLILLPFIENAFKHGPSVNTEHAWITIDLMIKEKMLFFKVENSKTPANASAAPEEPFSNGFGLKNVERRLNLLYPGKYSLEKKNDPEYYAIDLKLDLSEN